MTFLEKHDYDKTYKDSKIKMTQTQCNIKKKTARKLCGCSSWLMNTPLEA